MPVFLAPWFLLTGLAAVIPVALHLLHRRRPKPVPFSTLRFLNEAISRTRRSRHLTNFIVLLLRVLILLLLALSFARPKVRFATWLPKGQRTVVIVVDGSASMQYRDGDQTCFERATGWARQLVQSLDKDDRVALLIPGLPEPRVVFPPISDHEPVLRGLEQAECGAAAVDLVETLNDVLARLPGGTESLGVEIHLFSDFQKTMCDTTQLDPIAAQLEERQIPLFLNRVRPAVVANAGIASAAFYPPAILGDGEFQVRVQIRTASDYTGSNTLRLLVDGEEQSRRLLRLLPDQTLSEVLAGRGTGTGDFVLGRLELDPDGFAADNVYHFSLPKLPGIPVLLIDGTVRGGQDGRETFFLQYAIQPRGKARTIFLPKLIDWQTFAAGGGRDFNIVYLCNPQELGEQTVKRLEEFVSGGGTAVLMPGQNDILQNALSGFSVLKGIRVRKEELPQGKSLSIVPSQDPSELEKKMLSLMPPPTALVVHRRLVFSQLPPNANTVFRYSDGSAFLFEVPIAQGSLWVASVGANRDWSEWPLTPSFVVLQQELIKGAAGRNLASLMTVVGRGLALEWLEEATEVDFQMTSPSERRRVLSLTRTDSSRPFVLSGFHEPGFYRLERGGSERVVAVNIPEREIELSYLAEEQLEMSFRAAQVFQSNTWHEQQQNLVDIHHGRPLWPFFLCCALLLAVTEELFANIRSRTAGFPEALRQFLRRGARIT